MESVLGEIEKLRKGKLIINDPHNSNRYRVVCMENSGIRTAYYFTTPIYNQKTLKLITQNFILIPVQLMPWEVMRTLLYLIILY